MEEAAGILIRESMLDGGYVRYDVAFTLPTGARVRLVAECSAAEGKRIARALPSFAVECGAQIESSGSWRHV